MSILDKIRGLRAEQKRSMEKVVKTSQEMLLEVAIRDYLGTSKEDDHETAEALLFDLKLSDEDYARVLECIASVVDASGEAVAAAAASETQDAIGGLHRQSIIARELQTHYLRRWNRAKGENQRLNNALRRVGELQASHPGLFTDGEVSEQLAGIVREKAQQAALAVKQHVDGVEAKWLHGLNHELARYGYGPLQAWPELPEPAAPKANGKGK